MKKVTIPDGSMHTLDKVEVLKLTEKEELKAKITADIKAFEAKGGTTTVVDNGETGRVNISYNGKSAEQISKSLAAARGRKSSLLAHGRKGPGCWS